MQRQRFEQKYLLLPDQAIAIREFVAAHLLLDENGVGKPDYSYPVHSLYLDSPHLTTFWATINGDKNRYKLRLRFYNDLPDSPVFFEIKSRVNNCILKQRGGVRKSSVDALLHGQMPNESDLLRPDAKNLVAVQRFLRLREEIQATPRAHVCYQREAYVDPVSDAVRITFDRHVLTEARDRIHFSTTLTNPSRAFGDWVILELKFTNRFPHWVRHLVERFGLAQRGAAKYCEGISGLPEFGVGQLGDFREGRQRRIRENRDTSITTRNEPSFVLAAGE